MTIEKGKDWGRRGAVAESIPVVSSDRSLAELFEVTTVNGEGTVRGPAVVGLAPVTSEVKDQRKAQDGLAQTLGARGTRAQLFEGERTIVPIDLGIVKLYGSPSESGPVTSIVMAAGLVVASRFWSGPIYGAMNASFLGAWNVAPSGHPNDGRLDIVTAEMKISDRFKARKRLRSGSHVPHPDISIRRLREAMFTPPPSSKVWIDGVQYGSVAKVEVAVIADAVELAI